jgi:hypothetical protein
MAHVGLDGVHRQVELAGDLGRRQFGRQVAQDLDLALAERLAQAPPISPSPPGGAAGFLPASKFRIWEIKTA